MNLNNSRYGIRSNGSNHGDVFTSLEVIRFMLDAAGYTSNANLSNIRILEPAFGEGDFLIEIQSRIIESSKLYSFNPTKAFQECVYACEIDACKFDTCVRRIQLLMPDFSPENFKNEDFLFSNWGVKFNLIIGNPPYVRYENIPADIRSIYKSEFYTFHYRCDLYVLFYERSLKLLSPEGLHCFICPNRWLKNEYGKYLRSLIADHYYFEKLIDIENIDAFQETVIAYPAITIISNTANKRHVKFARIDRVKDLNAPIQYELKTYSHDLSEIFINDRILNFPTIEGQNFSIGIGVATGADKIFISPNLNNEIESELLMPIICAKDLSGNKFKYNGLCLLNPYDKYGKLVDLSLFPRAKAYLEKHKGTLQNRHIVRKNKSWYALIDKIKQNLLNEPKILLPDISANTYVFVDEGDFYPSHNIYYITSDKHEKENLFILAALLMSDFVRHQVINLSNKMNGGFPRWQSQVLRKIRIPCVTDLELGDKMHLIQAYKDFNIGKINRIVDNISTNISNHSVTESESGTQLSLFETSVF